MVTAISSLGLRMSLRSCETCSWTEWCYHDICAIYDVEYHMTYQCLHYLTSRHQTNCTNTYIQSTQNLLAHKLLRTSVPARCGQLTCSISDSS